MKLGKTNSSGKNVKLDVKPLNLDKLAIDVSNLTTINYQITLFKN